MLVGVFCDWDLISELDFIVDAGNKRKKIKEEPLSDIESVGDRQVKIEADVKQEHDTEVHIIL